jgi:hypothetical protein
MATDPEPKPAAMEKTDTHNEVPDIKTVPAGLGAEPTVPAAPDVKPPPTSPDAEPEVAADLDVKLAPTSPDAEPEVKGSPEAGENHPDALVARHQNRPEEVRGHRLLPCAHRL